MEEELSTREAIELAKTLKMMNDLFAKARRKFFGYVNGVDKGKNSDAKAMAMFALIDKLTEDDYDVDDYVGMLVVAIGTLVHIRSAVRGTALERELREVLGIPESAATPGTEAETAVAQED